MGEVTHEIDGRRLLTRVKVDTPWNVPHGTCSSPCTASLKAAVRVELNSTGARVRIDALSAPVARRRYAHL